MRSFRQFMRGRGSVLLWLAVLAAGSCSLDKVGLGSKVDITAPKVKITVPTSGGQYLSGTVHFEGTDSDDRKVASLKITYPTASGDQAQDIPVSGQTWSIDLPSGATGLAEGKDTVTVAATDDSGKVTTDSILLYVDNKAPTVLVTSPSTYGSSRSTYNSYVDITGQAYDASPVSKVTVTLYYTISGTAKSITQQADGTNTWSTRFLLNSAKGGPLGPADSGLILSYNVAVTDQAGNVNTYYYHSQDIYSILPSGKLFPPTTALGSIDGGTDDATSGIAASSLAGVRINGNAAHPYADLKFSYTSQPDVTYSNIDSNPSASVLAPGSVIVGTITPFSSADAVDISTDHLFRIYKKADFDATPRGIPVLDLKNTDAQVTLIPVSSSYTFKVSLKDSAGTALPAGQYEFEVYVRANSEDYADSTIPFAIDSSAPTLNETLVGNSLALKRSPFTLGGNAGSGSGLASLKVEESADGGTTWTTAYTKTYGSGVTSDNAWDTSSVTLPTGGADGSYSYKITLTSTTTLTSIVYRSVLYDATPPTVGVTSPTPNTWTGSSLSVSGTSGDGSGTGVNKVYYLVDDAANDHVADITAWNATDGSAAPTSSWKTATGLTSAWTGANVSLNAEGAQKLWVVASDKAGNTDKLALKTAGSFVTGTTYTIETVGTTNFTAIGAASNTPGLSFTATGAGSGTGTAWTGGGAVISFGRDDNPPVLTVTAPPASVNAATASSFQGLAGTAYDTNHAAFPAVTVAYTKNGAVQGTAAAAYSPPASSYSSGNAWSWTLFSSGADAAGHTNDGAYVFTVTATDVAGKTAVDAYNVSVDTTPPTTTITLPGAYTSAQSQYWLSGSTASFSGTGTDPGASPSGVAKVYYKIDHIGTSHSADTASAIETWTLAAGTGSWSATTDLTVLGEGEWTLWVAAVDSAGNVSAPAHQDFGVDQNAPTAVISSIPSFTKTAFQALGSVTDTNQLASMKIEQSTNGGSTWVTLPDLTAATGTSKSWDTGVTLPRDPAAAGNLLLADGTYEYRVTATDVAGKTSAAVTATVQIDRTPPTVSVSAPAAAQWLSGTAFQISGTSSDTVAGVTGVGVDKVEYSLDGGTTWTQATGSGSWTANLNLTALGEGSKTLLVRATDKAGNVSDPAASTVSFGVDQNPPSLSYTVPASTVTAANAAAFTGIAGTLSDTNAASVYGTTLTLAAAATKNGTAVTPAPIVTPSASWTLPFAVDAATHTTDGLWSYTFTATDVAGKTTAVTKSFTIDTQAPVTTVTSPSANSWSGSSLSVTGVANDGVGTGVSQVWVKADGRYAAGTATDHSGETPSTAGGWTQASGGTSFNASLTLSGEGLKTLWVKAYDVAGNLTSASEAVASKVDFGLDLNPPTLAFTDTTGTQVKAAFQLKGTTTDTNPTGAPTVAVTVDGGAAQAVAVTAGEWTFDVAALPADGSHTWVFTSTDVAGKTTSLSRTITVDTTPPTVSISQPGLYTSGQSQYWLSGSTAAFAGSAADPNAGASGVAKVYYLVAPASETNHGADDPSSTWSLATGTVNWTVTIPLTAEGQFTLWVAAYDNAGNVSSIGQRSFGVDQNPPTLDESHAATSSTKTAFTLGGNVGDTNALASLAITESKNGGAASAVTVAVPATVAGVKGPTAWASVSLPLGGVADGSYAYTVTATDAAGKTVTVNRTVNIDTTAPTVTLTAIPSWVSSSAYTIGGTATDSDAGSSGVATVWYQLDGGAWTQAAWQDLSGGANKNGTWSATLSGLAEGSHTIAVKALDAATNEKDLAPANFGVDTAAPTLDEALHTTTQVTKNTNFTLTGPVDDTNPLSVGTGLTVTVSVNGGAAQTATITGSGSARTWSFDQAKVDGIYSYAITATDISGKTTTVNRLVLLDSTAPTITVATPSASSWTAAAPTLSGTSLDGTGSGVLNTYWLVDDAANDHAAEVTAWNATDGSAAPTAAWKAAPTTNNSWSDAAAISGQGAKTLWVVAADKAGNTTAPVKVAFGYDTAAPDLAVSAPGASQTSSNASVVFSGTASDTNALASAHSLTVAVDGGAAADVTFTTAPNWSYTYTVDTATHTQDGTHNFVFTATDVAGKTTAVTRSMTIDTITPTLSVDGILSGLNSTTNQVNGVMTFRFSGDDSGVGLEKDVNGKYAAYYKIVAHGSPDLSSATAADVAAWSPTTPAASPVYSFSFDTTTVTDGQYDLYLALRDAVTGTPNVKVVKYSSILAVNQDSDRPVLSFDNLNVSATTNLDNTLGKNPVITVTITDDDQVKVSDLQYRIDIDNDGQFTHTKDVYGAADGSPNGNTNDKWENESVWYSFDSVSPASDASSVQGKIQLTNFPQGVFGIQVRARDNTDAGSWTTIYGVAANHTWTQSGVIPIAVDYGPPTLTAATSPVSAGALVTGIYRNSVALTGTTKDALGIRKVSYSIDNNAASTDVYDNASPLTAVAATALAANLHYVITAVGTTNWQAIGAPAGAAVGTSFAATGPGSGDGQALIDPLYAVPFAATVDLTALATGDHTLSVVSTDVTGSQTTQVVTVTVDKDVPTVTIEQPSPSATVNGAAVKVSGESSDNHKVGAVFLWSGLATAADPALPSLNADGVTYSSGGYTPVTGGTPTLWNATIDTTGQYQTAANGYRVLVVAVDAVGNVGTPTTVLLKVDQETDRPVITFSNLPGRLPSGNLTITGTVTDDDAVNHSSIEIRVDRNGDGDYDDTGEGWVSITAPPSADTTVASWSHTISDLTSQGNRHVQLRARDVNAPAFPASTGNLAADDAAFQSQLAATYGWSESASVAMFIDNGPPSLDLSAPTIGQKFNVSQFTLTGSTTDTNGIASVKVWVDDNDNQIDDSGEDTVITGPSIGAAQMLNSFTYTIATVGTTDFTQYGAASNTVGATFVATGPGAGSGTLTASPLTTDETPYTINQVISTFSNTAKPTKAVQVTSYDASGAATTRDLTIVYDPLKPTVTVNTPSDGSTVNGTVKVSGLADDNYQLSKIYYNISLAAAPTPSFPADYTELTGQTYSWNFDFVTTTKPDGAYKVRIVSQDSAGNDSSSAPATINLTVNQASDRPQVKVLTLNEGATAVNNPLPTSLQISGTVSDDDAVDASRIQIRTRPLPSGMWGAWSPISGPPTSNSTLATWNHTFTGLTDGQYAFEIRTADTLSPAFPSTGDAAADETAFETALATTWGWNLSAEVQFAIDLNIPSGTVTAPAQSSSQKSDVAITGTAADANGIKSVTIAYNTGSSYGAENDLHVTPTTDSTPVNWSTTFPVASVADGQVYYRVTITDNFSKVRTIEQYFTLDKTAPTIGFDSAAVNPDTTTGAYNGSVTFKGHADDNIKVSQVYYQFAAADPGAPDASYTGWTAAGSTSNWTAALDTTTVNNLATDKAESLWAFAVDGAGNVSATSHLDFNINQGSDQPVITLTAPTANQLFDVNAKALGTVTDDDGLASVMVRIVPSTGTFAANGSDYVAVTSPATVSGKSISLEHVLSTLADGSYQLQVRARDVNFTSAAATPFSQTESPVVAFSIDTAPPTLSLTKITVGDPYGGADRTVAATNGSFNGSYVNDDLTFTFAAADASGIQSVQVNANDSTPAANLVAGTTYTIKTLGDTNWTAAGAPASPAPAVGTTFVATGAGSGTGTVSTWNNATLASGNYTLLLHIPRDQTFDGTQNIQYRATDMHGKVTSALVTLIVDTAEPVIGFTSPASMPALSSADAPNVNGTVTVMGTVSDSSALASVVITGGTDNQSLTNTGNNLGWKVTFDSNIYAMAAHAISEGSNVWRFPVTVTATDIAGNKSQPAKSVGYIDIDPNSDDPIINVASPADGASVSGSFLINGTVADDDGAKEVRLQIDLNDDGVYGANGGFSGKLDLNGDGDTADDFEDETVVKVLPVTNGGWSILMNQLSELNKSNLVARGLATANGYIQFKVTPIDINGLAGAPQTERIYIDSTAPVISGLAADGTTPAADVTPATGSLETGTITVHALFKDDQSIPTANMQVSLDGGSNFTAVGSIAGASISGDVGGGNPYTYRIAIPVNTATAVAGGNGDLQISLKLTDQTFKQTTSSLTYHVDNTLPSVAWDTPAQLTNVSGGIYSFAGSATTGAGSVTANMVYGQASDSGTISGVDHVDVYFVKNGNQLYDPKNGGYTGVTNSAAGDLLYNQSGTAATGVPFTKDAWTTANAADAHHYAIRIDKRTELGQFDTNANLGDADGFEESLKSKSGYDEWYAYFDSTKLPDGPMTVYYVAYDQAGNKRYGTATGQIANNPPSVNSFTVGGSTLTGSPLKAKAGGANLQLTVGAIDQGAGPSIDGSSWKVTVLKKYAVGSNNAVGAEDTGFTPFFYGSGTGSVRNFSGTTGNSSASATATVTLNTVSGDGFTNNFWYLVEGQVKDADGNTAVNDFYLLVDNGDVTPPAVTIDAFDQHSVGRTTITSANIAGSTFSVALPSWMANGTAVTFVGAAAPGSFTKGNTYYIVNRTASTFQLSATSGGSAVTASSSPSTYYLTTLGHVEAAADSGHNGNDADLAGTVVISGTASDATSVSSLTVEVNGAVLGNATLTQVSGNAIDGYSYTWTYVWNTATQGSSAPAQDNAVVRAYGTDPANNSLAAGSRPTVTVDVAPYITSIVDSTGVNANVLRGSTGKYSIRNDGNTLTVNGYNFGTSAPTVYVSPTASAPASGVQAAGVSTPSGNQFTITKNLTRSGWLTVHVNGVDSFNNVNSNTLAQNSEATGDVRTADWTDDRYLWVWATTQMNVSYGTNLGTGSISSYAYPDMVMNGNTPEFSFVDSSVGNVNYTTTVTGAPTNTEVASAATTATRRTGFRTMSYATLAEATVNATLQRFILTVMDSTYGANNTGTGHLEVTGFGDQAATDGMGSTYSPSSGPDDGGTLRWSTIEGNDYFNGTQTNNTYRAYNRFPYPKMIAEANTIAGGGNNQYGANLYVAYFDAGTTAANLHSLNFVSFRKTGSGQAQPNTAGDNLANSAQDYARSTQVIAIPGTANTGSGDQASEYFDMVKIPGTQSIAIAYYNPTTASLKLAYSANAFNTTGAVATENLTNTGATWNTVDVDTSADVGQYVKMVQSNGKLYLAYYDFTNANLKMARVTWSGTGTPSVDAVMTVDSYQSAGTWTNIAMVTNSSLTGQASAQPVITYYADSYNGTTSPIRMAIPQFDATAAAQDGTTSADDNGSYTGSWEIVTIPAISAPKGGTDTFQKTQLGLYTNNSASLPVAGWVGTKPEYAKLQPNN